MADLAGLRTDTSPSGGHVVFAWSPSAWQKDDTGLAVIRTDGTGFRWIPQGRDGIAPAWSPDGRWIVFSRSPKAGQTARALYLYDTAAQTTRLLSSDGGVPIAWREDTQRFLTTRHRRDGSLEALWFEPTGEAVFRTPLPFRDYNPFNAVWWPHTDTVAVIGASGGTPSTSTTGDVYAIGPGDVRQVTRAGDIDGLGLAADGGRLLWARADDRTRVIRLYSYDRATGATSRIEPAISLAGLQTDPGFRLREVGFISFAPSGAHLVLVARFEGGTGDKQPPDYLGVYSSALAGPGLRLLRRSRPRDEAVLIPTWTRDAKHIVIFGGNQKEIFLTIHTADGNARRTLVSVLMPTPTPTPTPR